MHIHLVCCSQNVYLVAVIWTWLQLDWKVAVADNGLPPTCTLHAGARHMHAHNYTVNFNRDVTSRNDQLGVGVV